MTLDDNTKVDEQPEATPALLPPPKSMEAIVRRVVEISTLPQVALRVIEVAQDPDTGALDLKEVVEGDPALSARVLRIVNSAAYGLSSTVTNLHHAISYLGFEQVRNLALTASVSEVFKDDRQIGTYRRKDLWRHLVSVGICARLVACRCGLDSFEDCFLAGLLHDIGIIIADQHAHKHFEQVMNSLNTDTTLIAIEREQLQFDHTQLGAALATVWRFPDAIHSAIRFHHTTAGAPADHRAIVATTEIANVICTLKGITSVGVRKVSPPLDACRVLGMQKEDLLVMARDLDDELARGERMFDL